MITKNCRLLLRDGSSSVSYFLLINKRYIIRTYFRTILQKLLKNYSNYNAIIGIDLIEKI